MTTDLEQAKRDPEALQQRALRTVVLANKLTDIDAVAEALTYVLGFAPDKALTELEGEITKAAADDDD